MYSKMLYNIAMKTSKAFRLSDQALDNLETIKAASGANETAVIEMALAALAKGLTKESEMSDRIIVYVVDDETSERKEIDRCLTDNPGRAVQMYQDQAGELQHIEWEWENK